MRSKILLLAVSLSFVMNAFGQVEQRAIEELATLNGSLDVSRQIVDQLIDYQKTSNNSLPGHFWDSLAQEAEQEARRALLPLVTSAYQDVYTAREIEDLLDLYRSETGQMMVKKQFQLAEQQIDMVYSQWSHNVGNYIIEQIKKATDVVPRADEMEQFKAQFEQERGWEIMNFDQLLPDQRSEGTILIDFGSLDGDKDVTQPIILRNATDSTLQLESPPYEQPDAEILYAWSTAPVAPNDTTVVRVTFNAAKGEGDGYQSRGIGMSNGEYVPIGVRYKAPYKSIKYAVDNTTLPAQALDDDFSAPYQFTITNTGNKDFHVANVTPNRPIAYINYPSRTLRSGDSVQVRAIFSKALMQHHQVEQASLTLTIDLSKGEKGDPLYTDEQITVTIE